MAKIFRFSGYLVSNRENISLEDIYDDISNVGYAENWQQLHIEQSEEFNLDGEDKPNCDLALLTRHFKADNISTEFDRPLPQKGEKYKHFKIVRLLLLSVFQGIPRQKKYQLYMNMRGISGIDLLRCL